MIFVARHVHALLLALVAILIWPAQGQTRPGDARLISTGVYITSISDLEPADGSFRLTGAFSFVDPAARLDPVKHLQLLARNLTVHSVETRMLPDGGSLTVAYFDAVVDTEFDVAKYPFDRQVLELVLTSRLDVNDLVLVADNASSEIADVVEVPGWIVGDLHLSAMTKASTSAFGFHVDSTPFSRVIVRIDAERKRSPMVVEKFTGFLVALIITGLTFFVPAKEMGTRLAMLTSAVFAAVLNLNRLEDAIGFDAAFGLVDQVSLISFGAILASLGFSLHISRYAASHGDGAAARLNRRARIAFDGIILILLVAAFAHALSRG